MIMVTFRISGTAKVIDLGNIFEQVARLEEEGETIDLTLSATSVIDPEKGEE